MGSGLMESDRGFFAFDQLHNEGIVLDAIDGRNVMNVARLAPALRA
jgi:hypothetical protein